MSAARTFDVSYPAEHRKVVILASSLIEVKVKACTEFDKEDEPRVFVRYDAELTRAECFNVTKERNLSVYFPGDDLPKSRPPSYGTCQQNSIVRASPLSLSLLDRSDVSSFSISSQRLSKVRNKKVSFNI